MAPTREKRAKKIAEELSLYGDAAFTLDSNFKIMDVLRVEEMLLPEAATLNTGDSLLTFWGIPINPAVLRSEIENNLKWDTALRFNRKGIIIEILQSSPASGYTYLGIVKAARTLPELDDKPDLTTVIPDYIPAIFFCAESLQRDIPILFSGGVLTLTGYTLDQINDLPGRFLSIIHFDDVPLLMKSMNDFNLDYGKKKDEITYRIIKKDGTIIWVKENIACVKVGSPKKLQYQVVIIDITRSKEYENKLLESESKLIEINQSKDRFINILSHDLRAPFTSILGFSEILLNEPNLSIKEKNEYLTYIYDASQNQLQFIGYLLDWSRLRTGSMKPEPQRLRLQAMVYNTVSILTGNAIRKGITIHVDINEGLYVQADERLLTQILLNLLSNSIKFSFENSVIEITASMFNETHIEVVVKDSGVGIPPDDQAKIFSIEKTYSKEGTKGEKGSGFGLALVKEIIAKHEGEIWFYSEPEKGAEFHFTLQVPSNVVLLVSDKEEDRTRIAEMIRSAFPEFAIVSAENGYEAIGSVAAQTPNLIIAAHSMPLMSGLQLIEALRRGESDIKIPFVIVSGSLTQENEMQYYRLGAKAILDLSQETEEFVNTLRMILH
ncbi:MAG: PAS domain-containing protein [Ignavibacteriales bacterium]|nr:PAS domain-containing protein [Ignavibacteriales bacterium]